MKASQAFGLAAILILAGLAIANSVSLWVLGFAVVLAGLALLFFGGVFGRVEEDTKPPSPPAQP